MILNYHEVKSYILIQSILIIHCNPMKMANDSFMFVIEYLFKIRDKVLEN